MPEGQIWACLSTTQWLNKMSHVADDAVIFKKCKKHGWSLIPKQWSQRFMLWHYSCFLWTPFIAIVPHTLSQYGSQDYTTPSRLPSRWIYCRHETKNPEAETQNMMADQSASRHPDTTPPANTSIISCPSLSHHTSYCPPTQIIVCTGARSLVLSHNPCRYNRSSSHLSGAGWLFWFEKLFLPSPLGIWGWDMQRLRKHKRLTNLAVWDIMERVNSS